MSLFDAAFFKLLLKFAESKGDPKLQISPIQLGEINNKQFTEVIKNNQFPFLPSNYYL